MKSAIPLGAQCLENGEPHKAVDHFRKALRHESDDRATLYNLALALRREWQASEAKRVADKLSKIFQTRNNAAALWLGPSANSTTRHAAREIRRRKSSA